MGSWRERLEQAKERWRGDDLDGAAAGLREIIAAGDGSIVPEAAHLLGRLLQDTGDAEGARAAYRSVVASGDPMYAQVAALSLGMLLVEEDRHALAHRPLALAADGADAEIAGMAELALSQVRAELGDLPGAVRARERAAARGGRPAELAAETELPARAEDDGERERRAREVFDAITSLIGEGRAADEEFAATVESGLNHLLVQGVPDLCSRAAFHLYAIYADRGAYEECRRVIEHAIAAGDPEMRGMAEKLLGSVLFDLDEHAEAREAYRRAAADPRPEVRFDALIELAKYARQAGEDAEAFDLLWQVAEAGDPDFALTARACLGQVYAEDGDAGAALDCWRAVLDAGDPDYFAAAVHFLALLLDGLSPADAGPRAEAAALLREIAGRTDGEAAFQAKRILGRLELAERGPDEPYENAVDDCDAALAHVRAGEPDAARRLLRAVVDGGIRGLAERAAGMLALLELGEGDIDQAEELLAHAAETGPFPDGFVPAVEHRLIVAGGTGVHPVLAAKVAYQRSGREAGIEQYLQSAAHPDPAVSGIANGTLAQTFLALGAPRPEVLDLLDTAVASGDPLALSHAAVLAWMTTGDEDVAGDGAAPDHLLAGASAGEAAVGLLARARADGDPALLPWVAHAHAAALRQRGRADEAAEAYEAVIATGHPALSVDAYAELVGLYEARGDLAGAARVHERIVAGPDRRRAARSAWLLGFTRVRLDDLAAARAAFDRVPGDDAELGADGVFARRLLDGDFPGASEALATVREERRDLLTRLALETAHAWQRAAALDRTDGALSVGLGGAPEPAQQAALFLGALREETGDLAGAADAWTRAAAGPEPGLCALASRRLGDTQRARNDLSAAVDAYRSALDSPDLPADDRPAVVASLTELLLATGRPDEARTLYTGDAALPFGLAAERIGDLDAAAAYYREIIDGPPGTPDQGDGAPASRAPDAHAAHGGGPDASAPADADRPHGGVDGLYGGGPEGAGAAAARGVAFGAACRRLAGIVAGRGEHPYAVDLVRRAIGAYEGLDDGAGEAASAAYELGGYLEAGGDADGARAAYERAAASPDAATRLAARERLGVAGPVERGVLRLRDGDRDAARELFVAEYGAPAVADLHIALYENRLDDVAALFPEAGAEPAGDLVCAALLDLLEHGLSEDAERLHDLLLRHGTPGRRAAAAEPVARAYIQAGDTAAAVDVLSRGAAADDAAGHSCLRSLIQLLDGIGDVAAAEAAAGRAVSAADPDTAIAGQLYLADRAVVRGDRADAAPRYRVALGALEETGQDAFATFVRVRLARVLRDLGETGEAYALARAALHGDFLDSVLAAANLLAAWLAEDGDLAQAVAALGVAATAPLEGASLDDDEREDHAHALDNLGILARKAYETGDHATASRALRLLSCSGRPAEAERHAATFAAELTTTGTADHDTESSSGHAQRGADPAVYDLGTIDDEVARRERLFALADSYPGDAPDELTTLRTFMRARAGTPLAGAAGRRLIEAARDTLYEDTDRARAILELVVAYGEPAEVATAYDDIGDAHGNGDGDMDAAIAAYRKGAAIDDPAALRPLRTLMLALNSTRDLDGALEAAARAVETGDTTTVAMGHMIIGDVAARREDPDAAIAAYQRAVDTGETHVTARVRVNLARALRERDAAGDRAAARATLSRAAETGDEGTVRAQAADMLGRWAVEDDDVAAAAEAFARVCAVEPGPDDDEEDARDIKEWADGARRHLITLASYAFGEGRYPAAFRALALAYRAGQARDTIVLAGRWARAGHDPAALDALRAAASDDEPVTVYALGRILAAAGATAEARAALSRVPVVAPVLGRHALVDLGQTYADDEPKARELYLAALDGAGPDDGRAVALATMYLGGLAKRRRDWAEAVRWYGRAIEEEMEAQVPMAAAHLGELAYWLDDRDAAVRYYTLTLDTGTEDAELIGEASYRLGELHHAAGLTEEAAANLNRAVESGHQAFAEQARTLLDKLT